MGKRRKWEEVQRRLKKINIKAKHICKSSGKYSFAFNTKEFVVVMT
jgi:hypothetical protein